MIRHESIRRFYPLFLAVTLLASRGLALGSEADAAKAVAAKKPPIQWDAEMKEYTAKAGEREAPFEFTLTNNTGDDLTVSQVITSCGCTSAALPASPLDHERRRVGHDQGHDESFGSGG